MKASEETIKKLKELLAEENFNEARRLIRQLPYDAKELKDNLMDQVNEVERQYNLNQRINDTIERVKDLLTRGNFSEARRLIRQLPSEVRELKDNLLEQVDEAERQYNIKQRIEKTIGMVKDLLAEENFKETRRIIRQLPQEAKELKENLLEQVDEAEVKMEIKYRIEKTIEKVKDLLTRGNFSEARWLIRQLPSEVRELKDNLLEQMDEAEEEIKIKQKIEKAIYEVTALLAEGKYSEARWIFQRLPLKTQEHLMDQLYGIERRDGSKGGILNWLRTQYKKKKKYLSRESKYHSDTSKRWRHLPSSPDNKSIDAKSQKQINQIYRYTKVDCPQECSLDDEIGLSVQLTIKKPLKTAVRQLVGIPLIELRESIKLELKLTAPDFQVDQTQKTMTVPINNDSEKVTFKMKPLSIGSHLVEVAIYFNALRIGYFGLEIQVKDVKDNTLPDNPANITSYENPGDYIDHAFLPQSTIGDIKVDRFLHVDCVKCVDGFKLYFTLYPGAEYWETENISTKEEIIASLKDIASYITGIARKKYKNKEDELACLENMRGVGQYLFEKIIPEGLRIKIENWPSEKVLCISTNESWIPWELIDDSNGFWGERFLLFRIPRIKRDLLLSEQRKNISENLPTTNKIDKIVHVIGGDIETLFTEKAKEVFKIAESHASVITLEQRSFSTLIKQSSEADLLHFTCHGFTNPSYLQISDKTDRQVNLTIMSMQRKTFTVKNGSIVFSNACHSSSPDVIFGDFTNFGWEFYRKGTALFIGTIGTIPTEYAVEFSKNFYKWLWLSYADISTAFREAKREMNKKNNFFHLLYCLYANPILVR